MAQMRRVSGAAVLSAACAALGACGQDATGPSDRFRPYVFLTQPHDLGFYPEALFQGVVSVDTEGCIRLTGPEPDNSTVVWPAGATIERSGHAPRVLDRHGVEIGTLGGGFTLGGGHTPNLAAITDLSEAEMDTVRTRCPGLFWLVSP